MKVSFSEVDAFYKLVADEKLGARKNIYRVHGVVLSDKEADRSQYNWKQSDGWGDRRPRRRQEVQVVDVPMLKIDGNTVGIPPKREVCITGLNDNINEDFLRKLAIKHGDVMDLYLYHHPETRQYLGVGLVVFYRPPAAAAFCQENHGKSLMGKELSCHLDPWAALASHHYEAKTLRACPIPKHLKDMNENQLQQLRDQITRALRHDDTSVAGEPMDVETNSRSRSSRASTPPPSPPDWPVASANTTIYAPDPATPIEHHPSGHLTYRLPPHSYQSPVPPPPPPEPKYEPRPISRHEEQTNAFVQGPPPERFPAQAKRGIKCSRTPNSSSSPSTEERYRRATERDWEKREAQKRRRRHGSTSSSSAEEVRTTKVRKREVCVENNQRRYTKKESVSIVTIKKKKVKRSISPVVPGAEPITETSESSSSDNRKLDEKISKALKSQKMSVEEHNRTGGHHWTSSSSDSDDSSRGGKRSSKRKHKQSKRYTPTLDPRTIPMPSAAPSSRSTPAPPHRTPVHIPVPPNEPPPPYSTFDPHNQPHTPHPPPARVYGHPQQHVQGPYIPPQAAMQPVVLPPPDFSKPPPMLPFQMQQNRFHGTPHQSPVTPLYGTSPTVKLEPIITPVKAEPPKPSKGSIEERLQSIFKVGGPGASPADAPLVQETKPAIISPKRPVQPAEPTRNRTPQPEPRKSRFEDAPPPVRAAYVRNVQPNQGRLMAATEDIVKMIIADLSQNVNKDLQKKIEKAILGLQSESYTRRKLEQEERNKQKALDSARAAQQARPKEILTPEDLTRRLQDNSFSMAKLGNYRRIRRSSADKMEPVARSSTSHTSERAAIGSSEDERGSRSDLEDTASSIAGPSFAKDSTKIELLSFASPAPSTSDAEAAFEPLHVPLNCSRSRPYVRNADRRDPMEPSPVMSIRDAALYEYNPHILDHPYPKRFGNREPDLSQPSKEWLAENRSKLEKAKAERPPKLPTPVKQPTPKKPEKPEKKKTAPKVSKALRELLDPVTARDLKAQKRERDYKYERSPPPVHFEKRTASEEAELITTFPLDLEDQKFLKMGLEKLQPQRIQLDERKNDQFEQLERLHNEAAEPHIAFNVALYAPTPPLLKQKRTIGPLQLYYKDESLIGVMPHKSGSARTERYEKMTSKQKRSLIRRPEGPADLRTDLSHQDETIVRHAANMTREQKQLNRRLRADCNSDLFKTNMLNYRKKMIKFARSKIHGWGLYAMEDIAQDDLIVEYVGQKIRSQIAEEREVAYGKRGMGDSYLFRIDEHEVIDATQKGNFARFINHSCQPNCYAKVVNVDGDKRIVIYSKTAINKGDEITYDYKFPIEDDKQECLCGAPNCRGTLN
ncbi:unnamed protein product, partial [Mesorhabditis spiculigera]